MTVGQSVPATGSVGHRPPAIDIGVLGIAGVGLIGGSVAAAARARSIARRIIGFDPLHAEQAHRRGLIDAAADSLEQLSATADVIVLAQPPSIIADCLATVGAHLRPAAWCTDVGSTKARIAARARAELGAALSRFVPAHPIAGGEDSGPAAARADLFDGRRVIITPLPGSDDAVLQAGQDFWSGLGARVQRLGVEQHDAIFGAVSHLPHLLAFALAGALAERADAADLLAYAGAGLRDTTRIAGSDAALWADILLDNRAPTLAALAQFNQVLQRMAGAVQVEDRPALQAAIEAARQWRRRL